MPPSDQVAGLHALRADNRVVVLDAVGARLYDTYPVLATYLIRACNGRYASRCQAQERASPPGLTLA